MIRDFCGEKCCLPFVLVREIVPAVDVVELRGQRLAAALPEPAAAATAGRRLLLLLLSVVSLLRSSSAGASCLGKGALVAPERGVGLVVHRPPSVVSRPLCVIFHSSAS